LARLATPQPCDDERAALFLHDYEAASRDLADILGCDPDKLWGRDAGSGSGSGSDSCRDRDVGCDDDDADDDVFGVWDDEDNMQ
jgi:hypothetical protein